MIKLLEVQTVEGKSGSRHHVLSYSYKGDTHKRVLSPDRVGPITNILGTEVKSLRKLDALLAVSRENMVNIPLGEEKGSDGNWIDISHILVTDAKDMSDDD